MASTIKQTSKLLANQTQTATTLLKSCLNLASTNKNNAFITITSQEAIDAATSSTNRATTSSLLSPLDGIPIAIKDNFCMKGYPTTAASKMLSNFISPYDATVVARLKRAGAVIVGKTNMDEFGMGSASIHTYYGPVTNPHNALHVAGGSSGGSAAAVASGACFAAIGSDTGGSVRQPAAYCGLVGLKPAYGSVSRHGLISYASSLDTPGILARTVEDSQIVLNVIDGGDDLDSTSWGPRSTSTTAIENENQNENENEIDAMDLLGVRVGIPLECHVAELPKDVIEMWKSSLEDLVKRGAEIQVVSLNSMKYAVPAYYVLALAEASSNLSRYDGVRYGHRTDDTNNNNNNNDNNDNNDNNKEEEDVKANNKDFNKDITTDVNNTDTNTDTNTDINKEEDDVQTLMSEIINTEDLNAAALLHEEYQKSRSEGFGIEVQRRLLTGNYVLSAGAYDKYYKSATLVRDRIRSGFHQVFQQVDCIVSPVTTSSAPSLMNACDTTKDPVKTYLEDVLTVPASLAGLPSIAVPRGVDEIGLPLGMQITGPVDFDRPGGCSHELMQCAKVLEEDY